MAFRDHAAALRERVRMLEQELAHTSAELERERALREGLEYLQKEKPSRPPGGEREATLARHLSEASERARTLAEQLEQAEERIDRLEGDGERAEAADERAREMERRCAELEAEVAGLRAPGTVPNRRVPARAVPVSPLSRVGRAASSRLGLSLLAGIALSAAVALTARPCDAPTEHTEAAWTDEAPRAAARYRGRVIASDSALAPVGAPCTLTAPDDRRVAVSCAAHPLFRGRAECERRGRDLVRCLSEGAPDRRPWVFADFQRKEVRVGIGGSEIEIRLD